MLETILLVVHLLIALALIGIILIQRSEGGGLGLGGGGGGGGPGNFMSVRGTANLLTRTTAFLAVAFFCTSMALAILAGGERSGAPIVTEPVEEAPVEAPEPLPVIPTTD